MHCVANGKQWHLCILHCKKTMTLRTCPVHLMYWFPGRKLETWCEFKVLLKNDGSEGCHWDSRGIQRIRSSRTPWKDAPLCCCPPNSSDVIFAASPAICSEARFRYVLFVLYYEDVLSRLSRQFFRPIKNLQPISFIQKGLLSQRNYFSMTANSIHADTKSKQVCENLVSGEEMHLWLLFVWTKIVR